MQLSGTAQIKEPTCFPGSIVTSSVPNNNCVYSQISVYQNNSSVSSQWQNIARITVPGISSVSATSSLANIPQRQPRNSQGQTQISFRSGLFSDSSFQGQLTAANNPAASLVVGSPSNSPVLKNMEPSPNRPSQKSFPVCGRNVLPILSTYPNRQSSSTDNFITVLKPHRTFLGSEVHIKRNNYSEGMKVGIAILKFNYKLTPTNLYFCQSDNDDEYILDWFLMFNRRNLFFLSFFIYNLLFYYTILLTFYLF